MVEKNFINGYVDQQQIEMIAFHDEPVEENPIQLEHLFNQEYDYNNLVNSQLNSVSQQKEKNTENNEEFENQKFRTVQKVFRIEDYIKEANIGKFGWSNNYYEYQKLLTKEKFSLIHKLSIISDRIQSYIKIDKFIIKLDIFFGIFSEGEGEQVVARYIIVLTSKSEDETMYVQQFQFDLVDQQRKIQAYNDDTQDSLSNLDFLVKVVKVQNFIPTVISDEQKLYIELLVSGDDNEENLMQIEFKLDASRMKFMRNIPCNSEEIQQIIWGFKNSYMQSLYLNQVRNIDEIFIQMIRQQLKLLEDSQEVLVIKYEIEMISRHHQTFIYVLLGTTGNTASLSIAAATNASLSNLEKHVIEKFGESLSAILKK